MTLDPSQPPQPQPPAPPQKSRTGLYVGIGVGCLVLLLIVVGVLVVGGLFFARKVQTELAKPGPTRVDYAEPSPAPEPAPQPERLPSPAPVPQRQVEKPAPHETAIFVNRKEGLESFLAKNYFDAIFAYPKNWTMEQDVRGQGRGFIRVTRQTTTEQPHAENFQVGVWQRNPSASDAETIKSLAQRIGSAMGSTMNNFREFPLTSTQAGMYQATEWRFEGLTKEDNVPLWGRVLFLPPQDRSQPGAPLLTLICGGTTSPEVRSSAEVGVKGEMPLMLNTFRWGADYARAGQKIQATANGGGGAIVFTLLDINNDNQLDGVELLNSRLRRFDTSGDGVVSQAEYLAGNPSGAQPAPQAEAAPAPAPSQPAERPAYTERSLPTGATLNDNKKVELVAITLEGFQAGIRSGSFRRFYDTYLSNLWKKQISADAFNKAFGAFITAKVDLDPAAFREEPVFSEDRKEGQIVKFAGNYDIRTSTGKAKVNWKLDFIYENGRGWGLTQVNIQTQPYREL
jgi:hypothetical protein